jgi:hypothetical protein
MAAAVILYPAPSRNKGVMTFGPTKVFDAVESTINPDVTQQYATAGIRRVSFQLLFAGYTAVTVKFQRSLDGGTTWSDITGATTSTSGAVIDFAPEAPLIRMSVQGTVSVGADSLSVYLYMEAQPSK